MSRIRFHAGLFLPATPALQKRCSLRLVLSFDIRFRANSRLRSAPSVHPACAALRGEKHAVLASAPLAGFGDGQRLSAPVSQQ